MRKFVVNIDVKILNKILVNKVKFKTYKWIIYYGQLVFILGMQHWLTFENNVIYHINGRKDKNDMISVELERKHLTKFNFH